jgi:hypothetical protein
MIEIGDGEGGPVRAVEGVLVDVNDFFSSPGCGCGEDGFGEAGSFDDKVVYVVFWCGGYGLCHVGEIESRFEVDCCTPLKNRRRWSLLHLTASQVMSPSSWQLDGIENEAVYLDLA